LLKCNGYSIKDISYSNLDIKKLEIYGNYVFEKNEIIRKIKNAVKEFLNSNKDVDYLITYYYPTYEDMNNNIALCKNASYYNILNEANKMLQAVEKAYFILYELSITVNYRSSSELNGLQEHLERWLIKAEHINKFFCKLKPIVDYDFICQKIIDNEYLITR